MFINRSLVPFNLIREAFDRMFSKTLNTVSSVTFIRRQKRFSFLISRIFGAIARSLMVKLWSRQPLVFKKDLTLKSLRFICFPNRKKHSGFLSVPAYLMRDVKLQQNRTIHSVAHQELWTSHSTRQARAWSVLSQFNGFLSVAVYQLSTKSCSLLFSSTNFACKTKLKILFWSPKFLVGRVWNTLKVSLKKVVVRSNREATTNGDCREKNVAILFLTASDAITMYVRAGN